MKNLNEKPKIRIRRRKRVSKLSLNRKDIILNTPKDENILYPVKIKATIGAFSIGWTNLGWQKRWMIEY